MNRYRHLRLVAALAMAVAFPASASAQTTQIAACGQTLTGNGELTVDLDCLAMGGDAVTIDDGKLDMNGHTILGLVNCTDKCSVHGGGEIHGASPMAPAPSTAVFGSDDVTLSGLVVTGSVVSAGRLRIVSSDIDALVGGNLQTIYGSDGVNVSLSQIVGTLNATDSTCTVSDSSVTDGAVHGARVKLRRSTIDNAPGPAAVKAEKLALVEGSDITNSAGNGVQASYYYDNPTTCQSSRGKARVSNSTISDSAGWGVFAFQSVGLAASEVLGSGEGGIFAAGLKNHCYLFEIGTVTISGSVVDGGAVGVLSKNVQLSESAVTGWSEAGIFSHSLSGDGVTVSPGTLDPDCGVTQVCPDLATEDKPFGSFTCATSRQSSYNGYFVPSAITTVSWEVCAGE